MPNFKDFVLPGGGFTPASYAGPAATAYGGMLSNFAQAAAAQRSAEAQANATRDAARYGGLANAYGGYSSGAANALGSYSSLLGNSANANANAYGGMAGGLASLGQGRSNFAAGKDSAYTGLAAGLGGASSNMYGSYASALQGLANADANQAVGLANAYAGLGGQTAQGLGNAYGAYSSGIGNIAQARANEIGNRYNSNAMAEAARQAAMGNVGSAALGAYGSAAGSALGSYGQAESAYQNARGNALSAYQTAMGGLGSANQAAGAAIGSSQANARGQLGSSNQQAISNIASSRNAALSGLGGSYASAGTGLGRAALGSDIDISMSETGGSPLGGGFSATSPSGGVASGSYGGMYYPGSSELRVTSGGGGADALEGVSDRTFAGLEGLAGQIDSQPGYGQLANSLTQSQAAIGDDTAYRQLNSGMDLAASSMRDELARMDAPPDYSFLTNTLNQVGSGIGSLASGAYGSSSQGMNQFYANQPELTDYSNYLDRLDSGFSGVRSDLADNNNRTMADADLSDYGTRLSSGFADAMAAGNNLTSRAFDSIANNTYSDSDLLGGLFGGYQTSIDSTNAANLMGLDAYRGTSQSLLDGLSKTTGQMGQPRRTEAPSVAEDLLRNAMNESKQPYNPLKDQARREYETLVSGPTSRFNPASPDYNQQDAQRLAYLKNILRSGSSPAWRV